MSVRSILEAWLKAMRGSKLSKKYMTMIGAHILVDLILEINTLRLI